MTEQPAIKLANIIEAALLASNKPLNLEQMRQLFPEEAGPSKEEIQQALIDIAAACDGRGFELKEVASGYRFQIRQEMAPWVGKLWEEKPQRYTRALLETLALVAYRQPVTRAEIEEIRGVSVSSSIMKTLLEREWVRIVGYRDVPGRPAMYATTRQFLDYFSLTNLDELPPLSELQDIEKANQELALEEGDEAVTSVISDTLSSTDSPAEAGAESLEAESEEVDEEALFQEIEEMQKDLPEDFIDPAKLEPEELAALEEKQQSDPEEEASKEAEDTALSPVDAEQIETAEDTETDDTSLIQAGIPQEEYEAAEVADIAVTDSSSDEPATNKDELAINSDVQAGDDVTVDTIAADVIEDAELAGLTSLFDDVSADSPEPVVSELEAIASELEAMDEQEREELVVEPDADEFNDIQTSNNTTNASNSTDNDSATQLSQDTDLVEQATFMADEEEDSGTAEVVTTITSTDSEPADHMAADVLATELLTSSADTVIPSIFQDETETDHTPSDESLATRSSDSQDS
ncbi:SMC-Scp complex subunit ScpB [Endozoicomonas sp. SM1973]|uniref:SMC-Scp complex subunit ScpB n=2 Tax=Spartinivicinus marinus TaxID=2994442 RepID=A0A853I4J2_9GAMM|nr:SMC-Scp complex subunit ScpB [Spartinivicinus marinus]